MARKLRIECEQRTRAGGTLTDQRTGKQAWFYRGEDIVLEICIFAAGRMIPASELTNAIVNIYNSSGTAMITQVTVVQASMNGALTASQWRQGTAFLVGVAINAASTSVIPAGMMTLEIKGTSAGAVSIYASGTIEAVTLASLTTGSAPTPSPPTAYTKAESDALYNPTVAKVANAITATGQLVVGDLVPTDSRTKMMLKDTLAGGFALMEMKGADSNADFNKDGIAMVFHSKAYVGTLGYANDGQFYTLAGSGGSIFGCNSFNGMPAGAYAPTETENANGFIRFELGPRWPRSEVGRFANGGSFLKKFVQVVASIRATQTGYTLTATLSAPFRPNMVGKYIRWLQNEGQIDRIAAYVSSTVLTMESSREHTAIDCDFGYFRNIVDENGNVTANAKSYFGQDAYQGNDDGYGWRREWVGMGRSIPATLLCTLVTGGGAAPPIECPVGSITIFEVDVTGVSTDQTCYVALKRRYVCLVSDAGVGSISSAVSTVVGTDSGYGPGLNTTLAEISVSFTSGVFGVQMTGNTGKTMNFTASIVGTNAKY